MNGLLLFDKPSGCTSNQVLQQLKKLFGAKKAGHAGTLDPLATGILPVCFGKTTKIAHRLLGSDKTYQVTAQLGIRTTTFDQEGEVTRRQPVPVLKEEEIESVLARFRGEIEQIPPMFSALKVNGKRLYQLARQGIVLPRAPRPVRIYELQCVGRTEECLELEVRCGKGTYIRTLVDDIGEALGCGAHVKALRRTQVGEFKVEHSYTYPALEQIFAREGFVGLKKMLHLPQEIMVAV